MPLYEIDGLAPTVPSNGRFFVAPGAQVIGDVRIGEDVSIWFGSVLRADNDSITIEARANIQDGCLLHVDPGFPILIREGAALGHGAILHGCTIGENALVGMGATILNGAKIGRNSLVGARALVTEGKEFPENSLIIGSPAKVVRQLEAHEIERRRTGADGYVTRSQRYKNGLIVRQA
jgi:carbonic anhydrase/acetyltransferase-like protein (isoleucine patch superfamily)